MSNEPKDHANLSDLGMDLALSFGPSWAREADESDHVARLAAKHGGGDERSFSGPRGGDRRDRGPGGGGDRKPRSGSTGGRPPDRRDGPRRRDDRAQDRVPYQERRPAPQLQGWNCVIVPDKRGIEGLAKQIKASGKTYPLFDLARLVLEKSERYLVEFTKSSPDATPLFQSAADGTLWLNAAEASGRAMDGSFDKFYRTETVTVDPPKGVFAFVAVCGLSGTLLGPPNHHDYPAMVRKTHAERYAHMPFESYKGSIRVERDEELVAKWKEQQTVRNEYYTIVPEGEEPVRLPTRADAEVHFRAHHAGEAAVPVRERILVPGPAALNDSAPAVLQLTRGIWEELNRFPLPLAHYLGRQLEGRGLQVFKTHENITCAGPARPRFLDYNETPVSDDLRAILEYLESHTSTPRAEQWAALVSMRPLKEGAEESERETAMRRDLAWLLHEGHVTDYAGRGLTVARRNTARPNPPKHDKTEKSEKRKKSPRDSQKPTDTPAVPAVPEPKEPIDSFPTPTPPPVEMGESAILPTPEPPSESDGAEGAQSQDP